MPRARTIPDEQVQATIRRLMAEGGDKAVSFASVARATGLAGSTLAQRYGTRDGMARAALIAGWDALLAITEAAEAEAPLSAKGVPVLLKRIDRAPGADIPVLIARLGEADLRERADLWRARVETALAIRLPGGPARKRDGAAMIFAAWQGRLLWSREGKEAFRMKEAIKRLG